MAGEYADQTCLVIARAHLSIGILGDAALKQPRLKPRRDGSFTAGPPPSRHLTRILPSWCLQSTETRPACWDRAPNLVGVGREFVHRHRERAFRGNGTSPPTSVRRSSSAKGATLSRMISLRVTERELSRVRRWWARDSARIRFSMASRTRPGS